MLNWLKKISPLAEQLAGYKREFVVGDLMAGVIVAIMLVPQAMAYAMLAGLPPQVGLYASILPLVLYGLFGTSKSLSVGPVAMISILVVSGVGKLAEPGSSEYLGLCLTLALMIGAFQILMAVFRLGFLVNFISHPVLIGFTSASAIVIGVSQLKHLFGVSVARTEYPIEAIKFTVQAIPQTHLTTFAVGAISCLILVFFAYGLVSILERIKFSKDLAKTASKLGPLFVVAVGAIVAAVWKLNQTGVGIVGEVPAGLPTITLPTASFNAIQSLIPLALIITLVGYLESYSVASTIASRDREKVDSNRELFALGMADVGAAFTGGYPVTGGFSRSVVNYSAGARTGLASVITAILVALTVLFLAPLLFYIPNAVLAAVIIIAVASLVDLKTPFQLWKYSRGDALALAVTFIAVIATGIENGILIGIAITVVVLLWDTSRPHIAEVGRVAGSEHFRNIERHEVEKLDNVLAFRVDERVNFTNARCIESYIQENIAKRPRVKYVLLIASGINDIDSTGIETLNHVRENLDLAAIRFCLSDVKGPVTDRLKQANFDAEFLQNNVFLSADKAMKAILSADGTSKSDQPEDRS